MPDNCRFSESFLIGALVKRHGLTFHEIAAYTGAHVHAVSCLHLGTDAGQSVHFLLVELYRICEDELRGNRDGKGRRRTNRRRTARGGNRARDWRFAETGSGH